MSRRSVGFAAVIFVAALLFLAPQIHAAQQKNVRLAFSALAYANPPFWIAHELKFFEKYGLDSELVYVSGSRPIQAMLGGSVDVSQVGGAAAVAAIAQGAELAILGTVFTRLVFAVHAAAQIKQISDLRGKTIATGSVGGNSYFAGLLFLSRFGWAPNKDVGLIGAGGSPEVLAGLAQGKFQAGVMAPPATAMAARMGFREVFDLAALEFPFPVISVVATRRYIDANPDVALAILKATAEAIVLYRSRPDLTLPVVAKFMRVPKDEPALINSHATFGKFLNPTLEPSPEGIKFVLGFLAEKQPSLKHKNPADFVELRFIRRLEEEGFFKSLLGK